MLGGFLFNQQGNHAQEGVLGNCLKDTIYNAGIHSRGQEKVFVRQYKKYMHHVPHSIDTKNVEIYT